MHVCICMCIISLGSPRGSPQDKDPMQIANTSKGRDNLKTEKGSKLKNNQATATEGKWSLIPLGNAGGPCTTSYSKWIIPIISSSTPNPLSQNMNFQQYHQVIKSVECWSRICLVPQH